MVAGWWTGGCATGGARAAGGPPVGGGELVMHDTCEPCDERWAPVRRPSSLFDVPTVTRPNRKRE